MLTKDEWNYAKKSFILNDWLRNMFKFFELKFDYILHCDENRKKPNNGLENNSTRRLRPVKK